MLRNHSDIMQLHASMCTLVKSCFNECHVTLSRYPHTVEPHYSTTLPTTSIGIKVGMVVNQFFLYFSVYLAFFPKIETGL